MTTTTASRNRKENLLHEVVSSEKQLTASILSKGILHSDVKDLYYKVCSIYERIFMSEHEQLELQDVEYSLWKLHYKLIDEFRKRIKRSSANGDSPKLGTAQSPNNVQRSGSNHIADFRLFLLEATKFYQKLILKIREYYGVPKEGLLYKALGVSKGIDAKKKKKCQFLCHRLLVCLGDLARYMEQHEKPDLPSHKWLAAATHYLEATMVLPDSGNPHNQLAVLATYVNDQFLAMYHCVRSSAVKEPFPDAWDNLVLLFERNRSSLLPSLSRDGQFNFLRPSEKCFLKSKSQIKDDNKCLETDLFSLLIRTLGFFFIKSSLEEFTSTFTSMMRWLDELLSLDDSELNASLESYKLLDSVRTGPFRAIQIALVFIFMVQNRFSKVDLNDKQQLELNHLALVATFIVMGRLVERCLEANKLDSFPLLPAVLVFVEWLPNVLAEVVRNGYDEKSRSAMTYFFGVYVGLLERLNVNKVEAQCSLAIPLWEDYGLRGFTPLAFAHEPLDFSSHWEHMDNFVLGAKHRAYRIFVAATKISNIANDSPKWIIHDMTREVFYTVEQNELQDKKALESAKCNIVSPDLEEPTQDVCKDKEECEEDAPDEAWYQNDLNKKSVLVEDEEVILFNPLMRYNSAPISIVGSDDVSPKSIEAQSTSSDECLRRATSLLIEQTQGQSDPFAFHSDATNFSRNKPFEQHDIFGKDTTAVHQISEASVSTGPPSLSAWVLNRGFTFDPDREKGTNGFVKPGLQPIDELTPAFMNGLRLDDTENSASSLSCESGKSYRFPPPPPYSAPAPSAPYLPDDAVWFNGTNANISDDKIYRERDQNATFSNAFRGSAYSNWTALHETHQYSPMITGFTNMYPSTYRMTSSEWLRQYRENHNLDGDSNQVLPAPYNATGNLMNFQRNDTSRYDHLYQTGSQLASNPTMNMESPLHHLAFSSTYSTNENQKNMLFHGCERPNLYGCGATDLRSEQPPLLLHLKDKEWQLQKDAANRSAAYMGN
ncbi:protein SMG7L [Benincasa hispida]|uniref:protein SMG7L n=1 Tax=Benincasa hispida TaxID=102211 RepID=UPI0019015C53|nr:protein SMG7L [Benincasa hispida]XP_038876946.1 protein SMG7L [Benincasa hispida]XP_038876947.1 protein SMG7L [Benincasa hispida]XP_038876948.1 protein SMG7L [Benincasa hispida]